ncbi:MAG: hypothetical protein JNL98_41405, partial [Bryobacterales bacterium]|nr:hypothetical protein [Bryobacterales bacterium]
YHPDSKIEIDRRLDLLAERGRERFPRSIRFTTFTLAYNRMKWLIVDAIKEHWERATVTADMVASGIHVKTQNVTALTLDFESGGAPVAPGTKATIEIDGTKLTASAPMSDGSLRVHLRQERGGWRVVDSPAQAGLRKRHGLQGPIDDAFMDSFLFVLPTGEPSQKGVAERIRTEQERAIREWRRQFRGDARVKKDTEITDADIASANLVLWGDPSSNKLMARIAAQLPVAWTAEKVSDLPAANHYPAYIYPNPLNPNRYVVINSGFTYREFDYLNNARQIPKLPDWAIIDVSEPATGRWPGKVAKAGFFNEEWKP